VVGLGDVVVAAVALLDLNSRRSQLGHQSDGEHLVDDVVKKSCTLGGSDFFGTFAVSVRRVDWRFRTVVRRAWSSDTCSKVDERLSSFRVPRVGRKARTQRRTPLRGSQ